MKAITVVPGKSGVTLVDIPDVPVEGQVKVRTLHTGVCGTDREIVSGRLGIVRAEKGDTLVLGHEAVGIVEEAPGQSGFAKGDAVVPMVRRPGGCINCRNNRQDYCIDGKFTEAGIRGKDGFMREFFYELPEFLIKISDPANAHTCVLTEPTKNIMKILEAVTIASKRSLWELSGNLENKGVWIFGTGAEGMLCAAVFKNAGAKVMLVNRRSANEVESKVIERIGCGFFDSSSGDWDSAMNSVPMDMAIDMVGVPEVFEGAVPRLNRNGIIVLFGTGGEGRMSQFDGTSIVKIVDKNATVLGCEDGARQHYEKAVKFIEENRERYGLDGIITGHSSSADLDVLMKKSSNEIKNVIDWQ